MTKNTQLSCNYQGCHFGAWYEDASCEGGYLWDLDSSEVDESGNVYFHNGGNIPCPQCNTKEYVKSYQSDDLVESGYESFKHPLPVKIIKNPLIKWPSNMRRMGARYWRAGRREAIKEAKARG